MPNRESAVDCRGWRTLRQINGRVSLGVRAKKRGSKAIYREADKKVIVEIPKASGQPCGKLPKATLALWMESYEARHGMLPVEVRDKVLRCSGRQLDRITEPYKAGGKGRCGRSRGRTSHRLKTAVTVRCGPWEVDRPGWPEADTVSQLTAGAAASAGLPPAANRPRAPE
jgi:hypothetical protein